jgi:transcriptional regulator with XRE-family HTH domain
VTRTPQRDAPAFSARLREHRTANGISVRELARRLNVSPSLVSQIETGRVQPSVRTLYSIVSELGISLDELFELVGPDARVHAGATSPAASETVVCRADARPTIEFDSGVRWERIGTWEDAGVEFMVAVYGVGGSSSADGQMTRHDGREFGLALSGSLTVIVGFDEHVLEAGDSITFTSTTPHRLRNDGPEEASAIWVTLGRDGDIEVDSP